MRRLRINDDWEFRPKTNRFAELAGEGVPWTTVRLPHDAMIGTERSAAASAPNAYFPGGVWEYRKVLPVAESDRGTSIVLEFEGVYRDATLWVNESFVTQRPYGYSQFSVDVDHLLRYGEDNEIRIEARAQEDSRWYSGAGIYRDVWMLQAGRVHIAPEGVQVLTPEIDTGGAVIAVATEVRNRSSSPAKPLLRIEIRNAGGDVVASDESPVSSFPDDCIVARQRLYVPEPRLWDPDDPYLYVCRATLSDGGVVIDETDTTFGIRSLSVDPRRGLRINGKSTLLRGACVHHDNGPLGSATIGRAEERRVELLKAAGFNAIRSSHNPMSRAMLDACDRLGMLVMDETFDIWKQPKSDRDYSLRFAEWWQRDVEAMVRKDINHPSVILYSIGNEIPDETTADGLRVGRQLVDAVRSLDGSRLITKAVSGMLLGGSEIFAELRSAAGSAAAAEVGVNTAITSLADLFPLLMPSPLVTERTREAFSSLDVAGYNYMHTRFEQDADLFPNRVIVASETHASTMDKGWAGVAGNSHVIGDFTWTGWDYLGEPGIGRIEYGEVRSELGMTSFLGDYPWLTATCGDIDITGFRRPQSYYREIVYGLRRDPYIAVQRQETRNRVITHSSPWSWSDTVASWSWPDALGAPVVVEVYSDADEVELLINGRSLGRQASGSAHRFRAAFEFAYEPGRVEAIAWNGEVPAGRAHLESATGPAQLELRADRSAITCSAEDLSFVDIALTDANGVVQTTADREVTVQVDGPAVLQGLASARPSTLEPFTARTCTTFDGRAIAVMRPTGAGRATVTVTADGCAPQSVHISCNLSSPSHSEVCIT